MRMCALAKHSGSVVLACALVSFASAARGATIEVTPADSFAKIEAAKPGDEVIIDPGTYKFRVYLQAKGTATLRAIAAVAVGNSVAPRTSRLGTS